MKKFINYLEQLQEQRKVTRTQLTLGALGLLLFLALAVTLPTHLLKQNFLPTQAAGAVSVEIENATVSGNVTAVTDASASGGVYMKFGSASATPTVVISP